MPLLSIVVVSDLHSSPDNPFPELKTPTRKKPKDAVFSAQSVHANLDALSSAIENVVDTTPPSHRVLVCAGDLSSQSHADEFRSAGTFLESLATRLQIPVDHRALVPGNHDIDWSLTKLGRRLDPWYDRHRQTKFQDVLAQSAPTFSVAANGALKRVSLGVAPLDVFILDSPWDDKDKTEPHRGRLGKSQLESLDAALASCDPARSKIVVLHHHVTAQGRVGSEPDFSLLIDARDLLDLLERHQVLFAIHGHQHRFILEELLSGAHRVHVLGAGSTSAHPARIPLGLRNSFHVITFDSLTPSEACGMVHTRVLHFGRGWVPPHPDDEGIPGERPFGHNATPRHVETWARLAIRECLRTDRALRLVDFLAARPERRYFDATRLKEAIERELVARRLSTKIDIHYNDKRHSWQMEPA